MEVTKSLCEWAYGLRYEDIPTDCIEKAKDQLMSIIGASITGVLSEGGKALIKTVRELGGPPVATIFGTDLKCPASYAAMTNSYNAQIYEWEDWVIICHTGASVVPTAMAVCEANNLGGKDLLTAIIMGNEINGRAGKAMARGAYVGNSMPNHQIDTALVAGKLMGLSTLELRRALGVSCFMAMENCPIGWTSDAKGFANGFPSQMGILSAILAKNGFVGNQEIVEHPAGYLSTVSEAVDYEEMVKGLGKEWLTLTLHTKPYPTCGYNISAVEAAIELVTRNTISPENIEKVEVFGPGVTSYVGTRYHAVEPDLYSKIKRGEFTHVPLLFDIPYPISAAIVDKELTWRQFTKERIFDPLIQSTISKIEIHTDLEYHRAYYRDFKYGSMVSIRTKDGKVYKHEVPQMKGAPDRSFDVSEKFIAGSEYILGETETKKALELIKRVETLSSAKELTKHLVNPKNN